MPDDATAKPPVPPLVTMGDPRLAQPSVPVEPERIATATFRERLETLVRAMVEYLGVGIAAPQIGWFERFFVMVLEREGPDGEPERELQFWINPEIVSASDEHCWAWEGCLSVPGLRGWIRRPAAVAVRGYNEHGERVAREYRGWDARVFQHEYDHLEGMLFPYRAADPRHVVMTPHLEQREAWPPGWPAPGAREAPLGDVVPEE
jgi:peptide deformylase